MHPFIHGDDAVAAAFRPREHRPSCDYPFFGAHRTALDAWRSWVADEGETTAQLEQARRARHGDRRTASHRRLAVVGAMRQTIGAILIGIGQRVQGMPAPTRLADATRATSDQ